MAARLPIIFFGHGNPMNALYDNEFTQGWNAIGKSLLTQPRAILCISAHWYIEDTAVTAMQSPRTIHDFGGFPRELYQIQYPAPGSPALANEIQKLLESPPVSLDQSWGLDHGTWSVLCHALPSAAIPVVQLSIDKRKPAVFHYELAKKLAPLRDQNVLIVGSGNLVHNLHTYAWGKHSVDPYDWAVNFERRARELLTSRNHEPLIDYPTLGRDAELSIPTPDHYLPLLYITALANENDEIDFPVEGFDGGSVSMLCVRYTPR